MNSRTSKQGWDWRRHPLLTAFVCSCIVHLVIFLLWRLGILELPDQLVRFFVKRRPPAADLSNPPQPTNAPLVMKEIPLAFIEIEPNTAPAPRDPKFYSAANSSAANPEPAKETATPKSDGRQDKVPRLRDVPRAALPPTPPPPPPPPVPRPTPPPPKPEMTLQPAPVKEPPPPGNTEQARTPEPPKPQPQPQPKPQPPEQVVKTERQDKPQEKAETRDRETPPAEAVPRPKPRSLAAARQQAGIAGEKMKQEGGVHRVGKLSVDAKATPFGEYDAALIRMVQERWYYLLDNTTASPRSGKVVLTFNLMYDGRVTDASVRESEVGEALGLLCQRAVTDPSPYPKWPTHMHQTVGGNVRPVTITFFYY